jgi:hypothetical protein
MKKEYITPGIEVVKLQHTAHLLEESTVKHLESKGWDDDDTEDELNLSEQGGSSSVWDR